MISGVRLTAAYNFQHKKKNNLSIVPPPVVMKSEELGK